MILQRLTIRQRILMTFMAVILVGGTLQLVVAGRQLQAATLEFYQHHLETDAMMVASALMEPIEHYQEGEATNDIQETLALFQQQMSHEYVITDQTYQIIDYSDGMDYGSIDRVLETPEFLQASRGQLGADTRTDSHGVAQLYVAAPVIYERNILGYLVLVEPMQPAYDEANRRWLELASGTLPVIGLVITASLWISGSISHPIKQLRDSAIRMAHGALDTRVEGHSQDEVGQLGQTFNFMAAQIETLMKMQRSFVSNAAHELRTPLTTLKLRVEALQDEALSSDERVTYLHEIHQQIDHMAALVSSLLIMARVDEGRYSNATRVVDAVSVFHDLARQWRIEATKSGLNFDADIAPHLPELPLSQNDLRLVLDNLLGNAIKYTPQGSVQLAIYEQDCQLVIRVNDTGIGFTSAQGNQLFDRFYRADTARARFSGNGLGLSIVKAVVEQYNGQINAESAGANRGATFTVYLPLSTQAAPIR